MIQVKMYPAKNGDCFLISAGDKEKKHILIDCGYAETYKRFLKNDFEEIAKRNERINLMIVTHIDADHISGAIKFLEDNNKERFIEINEVWFNAYRHLQISKANGLKLQDSEKDILEREIALGKSFLKRDNEKTVTRDEISAKQGSTLGALLLQGKYKWNSSFDGNAVVIKKNQSINVDDFKIKVLSPNEEKLKRLGDRWVRELRNKKWNFTINKNELFDDAFEFMQLNLNEQTSVSVSEISKQYPEKLDNLEKCIEEDYPIDDSVNNGSSIAVLIEYNNRKLLFLADAHPDIIYEKLKEMGENSFDLVKVSHHGSLKNTTFQLAKFLCSPRYLFSTNGNKHDHPDSQSVIKILAANEKYKKNLYFNYKTKASSLFENSELQKKYNYKLITGNEEIPLSIKL